MMTAEEIWALDWRDVSPNMLLQEIAYQLALMNERQAQPSGMKLGPIDITELMRDVEEEGQ